MIVLSVHVFTLLCNVNIAGNMDWTTYRNVSVQPFKYEGGKMFKEVL